MFGIRLGLPPGVGLRELGVGHTPFGGGECARLRIQCATPTTPRPRKKEHAQSDTAQGYTAHVHTCAPHTRVHLYHSPRRAQHEHGT